MHVHMRPFLPSVAEPRAPLKPAAAPKTGAYASLSAVRENGGRGSGSSRRQPQRQKDEPDRDAVPNGNTPSSALAILLVTLDLDAAP